MTQSKHGDGVGRFSSVVDDYDRYRPDYPRAALDALIHFGNLRPGDRIADVGCGTGISSRQLADLGLDVIGVEPNDAMRQAAEQRGGGPIYVCARADALPFDSGSLAAVVAAQAFHWFATVDVLREFARVLRPGGVVAMLWNEADTSDPFTTGYRSALITTSPEPEIADRIESRHGAMLLQSDLFTDQVRLEFPHSQAVSEPALLGRAFSASYAPREAADREQLAARLKDLYRRFAVNQQPLLRYRTALYLARKP